MYLLILALRAENSILVQNGWGNSMFFFSTAWSYDFIQRIGRWCISISTIYSLKNAISATKELDRSCWLCRRQLPGALWKNNPCMAINEASRVYTCISICVHVHVHRSSLWVVDTVAGKGTREHNCLVDGDTRLTRLFLWNDEIKRIYKYNLQREACK